MSRTSTSRDYTGRTVDLCLFPTLSSANVPSDLAIGPSTRAIAGPSKACQKFLIVFLTEKGSDAQRPDMGTNFPAMLRSGQIFISPGQIEQIFNIEALVAINYLNSVRAANQPADEIVTQVLFRTYSATRTGLSISADAYLSDGSVQPMLLPVIWQP